MSKVKCPFCGSTDVECEQTYKLQKLAAKQKLMLSDYDDKEARLAALMDYYDEEYAKRYEEKGAEYSCSSCGQDFYEKIDYSAQAPLTKISFEEYYKIIEDAIEDCYGAVEDTVEREMLKTIFQNHRILKVFFKEAALKEAKEIYVLKANKLDSEQEEYIA